MNTETKDTLARQTEEKRCPRLDEWTFYPHHQVFTGTVYDHPRFKDGDRITTSRVVRRTDYYAETLNTEYVLGRERT